VDEASSWPRQKISAGAITFRADTIKRHAQHLYAALTAHLDDAPLPDPLPLTDMSLSKPARRPGEFNSPSGKA
jgi:hypothetical protein